MRASLYLCVVLLFLSCLMVVMTDASIPAQSSAASPISAPVLNADGTVGLPVFNPVPKTDKVKPAKKKPIEKYRKQVDFLGSYAGVPMNPTRHLQKSLQEDKQYIASIFRAPLDLGDPTDCKHSDLVKDEQELRKIALRINHRRVSLRQQTHWIDSATDSLKTIENEIGQTTDTARNLAEQLDALEAQKQDILNHVRRAVLIKELDSTSSNLMRLKDSRVKEEVSAQQKHNKFAIRNARHNKILKRLNRMRTKMGLALGKLDDPKPYRFAQEGMQAAHEEANQAEAETAQESEQSAEAEAEASTEVEAEVDSESEADAGVEADTEAEAEGEQATETESQSEAESEQSSESESQAEADAEDKDMVETE